MGRLELACPPPLLWVIAAVLTVVLARWVPQANFPFAGHRIVAIVLVLAGIVSGLAGISAFRYARTTIDPHHPERTRQVVSAGIYRYTRNPMYLGLLLALLGVVAWSTTAWGLPVAAGFCAYLARFQVRPEERALEIAFGDAYVVYKRRVRRWI